MSLEQKHEQKEAARRVRGQVARRLFDSSMLNISVIGANVHFTGVISTLRSHPHVSLQEEMDTLSKILRQHGIREVVWDVSRRGEV